MDKTSDCAMNTAEIIEKARQRLHAMPELACEEVKTKAFIIDFLRAHTSMEVHDMGRWLFAAHFEQAGETVAFRADFDAVPTESGGAAHRCGHDGHTAALLGLALLLEGKKVGRNVILLFQHAEEVGFGAPECCRLFELEHIDKMYGCHNIPGEQMGRVLLRKGTFACASCGLEIKFIGKPTHAAYPENGVNPTPAVSRLALALPQMAEEIEKRGGAMTIATIVGMYTGEKAFGVAAAQGALYATLRSENGACLEELLNSAKTEAQKLADEYGLQLSIGLYDKFPATVNTDNMVDEAEHVLNSAGLDHKYLEMPFRWSEDFGHYGKYTSAMFFGIGSGEDTCPLHTEGYVYPEGLAAKTAQVMLALICAS